MFQRSTRNRRTVVVALCLALLVMALGALTASAATTVTPSNPDGWLPTDVRSNATVGITTAQPRSGAGSLQFQTVTVVSGQDKADFTKTWVDPTRTLGTLSDVSFEYYRDSSSTTAAHYIPVLRLLFWEDEAPAGVGPEDHVGYLIWEGNYNGIASAPTNSWQSENLFTGNFWMRYVSGPNYVGGCERTIQNFNVTLNDWITGNPQGQPGDCVAPDLDANTNIYGVNTGVGSGWGANFLGYVDNVELFFGADEVSANFEPDPQCAMVCYADAVNGNDANDGITPATAKKTIQAAIDQVSAGGQVRVLPGSYDETATGRDVLGAGSYQFGLFFEETAKDGVTLMGVTAADVEITDPALTEAVITTNATNNFGFSGIFVEADDVTITGLEIGDNTPSNNKTIEVIGEGFTFANSFLNVSDGGSLYFGDWRFDTGTDTSYIQTYTVDNNIFSDGSSVDLTSGAGYSGPASGRLITNNEFEFSLAMYTASGNSSWPNVSFTGDSTTVPWFLYPMSGATITGNTFNNQAPDGRHIRARGIADDSTFDWESYWNDNTFNKAVIVGPNLFDDVRAYNYTSGSYILNDVRQIGAVIQPEIDHAVNGDTVMVSAGTFPEAVAVNKEVTVIGDDPTTTIIDPPAVGNGLTITASNVTIKDLQVTGSTQGARLSGAISHITFDNVHFLNNISRGIEIQNGAALLISDVKVLNSLFDNSGTGMRMSSTTRVDGILIENTTFQNNTGSGFNQANDGSSGWVKNLTVRDSTFTNNGTSSGHAGVYAEEFSNVLIEDSTFTGNQYGINLWDAYNVAASVTTNVIVRNNTFTDHKWSTIALRSNTSDPNAQLFLVENNTINQDVGALVGAAQAHLAVTTSSANPNGAVDVVDNTLNFSGTFPTGVLATYGVYLSGGLQDVRVEGNEIDGGNVGTNGATIPSSGIRLVTSIFQTNADITITKNLINNFVNGVTIHDANNAPGGIQATSNVDINRNNLNANSAYGIQGGQATEADGTCNWWGAADGPGPVGPGTGSDVSAFVDFAPWLFTDDLDGDCYIGGTITVIKEAGETGDQFEFDPSWGDNFFLSSGGSYTTAPPLQAGVYSVAEVNLPDGWSLDSASCVNERNGNLPVTPIPPSQIPVEDGDNWVCTFTNVYTPPPASTCMPEYESNLWTDIIGKGMGSPKKHKNVVKLPIFNYLAVEELYGQMVAKNNGEAKYVRFILPGKNNFVQVDTITSPAEHNGGNFWYGDYIDPAKTVSGRWFLQKSGVKNHIPRAMVLYPTYADPVNTYVNVWDTFDASEGEVHWDTANGWTPYREIVVAIAPPNGATTFNVELALVDNDKDARPVWVTVTAGGVTQTVMPTNPSQGDQLNLLAFELENVPAGTDEIVIEVYSPSVALDGIEGDSAMLVGMAANYQCEAIMYED